MAENEARRETDELLRELEREINREYRQAEEELRAKLRQYLADYERKDRIKREQVKRGIITEDEYVRWRMGQLAIGQRWQEQIAVITQDMRNAGEIAHSITDGYMPSVYALNHNYATYEAEKGAMVDTSYTLYSREAVERMMREDPELLPAPGRRVNSLIAQGKANRWDRKVVQSSMVQGILQGESIPNIATRISRDLGETNRKAALRYARTMTTGAENAGHVDAYERAQSKGIEIRQMWLATLDGRTRDSHREMDGETVEVGGTFSNGCRFPGDPSGPAEEVWNCRCRVIAQVKGFEHDPSDLSVRRSDKMGDMSYEEWREAHGVSEPIEKPDEIARRMRYAYGAEYRKGMKGVNLNGEAAMMQEGGASEVPEWLQGDYSDFEPLELTEQERAVFEDLAEKTNGDGFEHGCIIDNTGNPASKQYGGESSEKVGFPKDDIKPGSTLLHTHTNSTPLSTEDLKKLCNTNVDKIGVRCYNDDVFTVERGSGEYIAEDEFAERFSRDWEAMLSAEMAEQYAERGLTTEQMNYVMIREKFYRICRELKWTMRGGALHESE